MTLTMSLSLDSSPYNYIRLTPVPVRKVGEEAFRNITYLINRNVLWYAILSLPSSLGSLSSDGSAFDDFRFIIIISASDVISSYYHS